MKKYIYKTFLAIFIFSIIMIIRESTFAAGIANYTTISKNCFLFPIANTDVEMTIEYGKATQNSQRIYNNGPIAPQLMTGNYTWKEEYKVRL